MDKRDNTRNFNDRYSSVSKAEVLSRALSKVLSEKRSSQNRPASSSVSRLQKPAVVNATVRNWRDVDSQANRYRAAIKETERL